MPAERESRLWQRRKIPTKLFVATFFAATRAYLTLGFTVFYLIIDSIVYIIEYALLRQSFQALRADILRMLGES